MGDSNRSHSEMKLDSQTGGWCRTVDSTSPCVQIGAKNLVFRKGDSGIVVSCHWRIAVSFIKGCGVLDLTSFA